MTTAILTFGYPGSGKGTFLNVAQDHQIPTITMGDIVRKNAKRAYSISGDPNEFDSIDNSIVGPYATTMRELHGYDVMARLTVEEIQQSDLQEANAIVIDGARSLEELKVIKGAFDNVVSVYIEASRRTRLQRLRERARDETEGALTFDGLTERDEREDSWGLADVVESDALDTKIVNERTLEAFEKEIEALLDKHLHAQNS